MNAYEFIVIPFPDAGRFCTENDRLQFLYEKFQKQYEKAPHLKFPQRLQVYIHSRIKSNEITSNQMLLIMMLPTNDASRYLKYINILNILKTK